MVSCRERPQHGTRNLVELYCSSVGRNSKLLLNVPTTRDGLLHATESHGWAACANSWNATFAEDCARGSSRGAR